MRNTPEHCSDETINQLWDGGPNLPTYINPETLLGNKPVSVVIDLQRKYTFVTRMVGTFRKPMYDCIDTITYDPDPDSRWHCVGYGETEGEAKADLLEKIAWAVAHE